MIIDKQVHETVGKFKAIKLTEYPCANWDKHQSLLLNQTLVIVCTLLMTNLIYTGADLKIQRAPGTVHIKHLIKL